MEQCPFLKSEGFCCCPLDKLSNPVYAGVAFVVFNLGVILINCYEVGVVSLVSYGFLFAILFTAFHVKVMQFLNKEAEQKPSVSDASCDEKNDQEQFKKVFEWVYNYSNEAIQFLRKVILVKDIMLTAKFVLILYVASQVAYVFGDFCFFVFLGNDCILMPLVCSKFGHNVKGWWEQGKNLVQVNSKKVLDRLPKYSDLKKD